MKHRCIRTMYMEYEDTPSFVMGKEYEELRILDAVWVTGEHGAPHCIDRDDLHGFYDEYFERVE